MGDTEIKPSVQIVISNDAMTMNSTSTQKQTHQNKIVEPSKSSILTKLHAGYFSICISFAAQALLWKHLSDHRKDLQVLWHAFNVLPSLAFLLLWGLSVFIAASLSFLYILRCFFHFDMVVKTEFLHHIGMNYMYAPCISWLLILQSAPMPVTRTYYQVLCWAFSVPILALDVKLYGQWFTTEKRFLWVVANPVSQISVIGNLVSAQVIAEMGWKESAVSVFSLGFGHYLILFVTLYQRTVVSSNHFPRVLRPAYFLFFAAPSMASLAWKSLTGPALFKKSMKRLTVAWWVYSFPLTFVALASAEYALEVKDSIASGFMLVICGISLLVFIGLMLISVLKVERMLHTSAPFMCC
ncbi:S-type anion channel SLAH1 [Senna tora]|uniref:S-type anion channel SLAH1 n=1 Tax=Senna tora TaxID=362788 RepID=A0A834WA17_9FABA|nr:S-type anion channel SLAH1 [Senna tora]